ncbi:hypothetical protein [Rubrivirga sp.]|uniref:hypothetical protein n=1 Tax=Rubrivirga sp. TaxID=1885344 RepID=UPI003C758723
MPGRLHSFSRPPVGPASTRFALALAAVFALAVVPSAQSIFDQASALDAVEALVFQAEAAPSLSADLDLEAHVAPAVVDVLSDDPGLQENSGSSTGESVL